jgi:hypothetical protein
MHWLRDTVRVTRDKVMPIDISDDLRHKFVSLRESQLHDLRAGLAGDRFGLVCHAYEELQSIDGIHLWGTLGADLYLTFDGRLLLSEDCGDRQSIEEVDGLAFKATAFTTGAYASNLPELLNFLPARPVSEPPCSSCKGLRTFDGKRACPICCGVGWGKRVLDKKEP